MATPLRRAVVPQVCVTGPRPALRTRRRYPLESREYALGAGTSSKVPKLDASECQVQLTASDAATNDNFGISVAISGAAAVVGAPNNSTTGAAYLFVPSGTTWTQQAKVTASDAAPGDKVGGSVAISGTTAVVGAPSKHEYTGAAYVFSDI
jgi:FG-GAP repeat